MIRMIGHAIRGGRIRHIWGVKALGPVCFDSTDRGDPSGVCNANLTAERTNSRKHTKAHTQGLST